MAITFKDDKLITDINPLTGQRTSASNVIPLPKEGSLFINPNTGLVTKRVGTNFQTFGIEGLGSKSSLGKQAELLSGLGINIKDLPTFDLAATGAAGLLQRAGLGGNITFQGEDFFREALSGFTSGTQAAAPTLANVTPEQAARSLDPRSQANIKAREAAAQRFAGRSIVPHASAPAGFGIDEATGKFAPLPTTQATEVTKDDKPTAIAPSAFKGNSIVDFLKSTGADSSFSARKDLAAGFGIQNYTGTATQNLQLLGLLRSGTVPAVIGPPKPVSNILTDVSQGDLATEKGIQDTITAQQAIEDLQFDTETKAFMAGLIAMFNLEGEASREESELIKIARDAMKELEGEEERELELIKQAEIAETQKQIEDLRLQMANMKNGIEAMANQAIPTPFIIGQQREQMVALGALATMSLALQENLLGARQMIQDTLNIEFGAERRKIENAIILLKLNQPRLDRENTIKANLINFALNERTRLLNLAETNKEKIMNFAMTAIQNGVSSEITNSIMEASTPEEALRILGANVAGGGGLPSILEQLAANEAGFDIVDGRIVSQERTGQTVTDASGSTYDIGTYATDPNHEARIQSILDNMGQMTSIEQMDNYIQSVAPGSQVTGQMIANASGKFGVSWEIQMAIMQQDSTFATVGLGSRNNNPGNVGQFDSLGTKGVAGYATMQEGVDAVARNLAGRVVSGGIDGTGTYPENIEFGFNEKIDVSRLPDLGGKQITNKTARQGNLPFAATDKQADWIIEHRPGNVQFQQLKSKEFEKLADLLELREDITEIRELKKNVNTGPITAKKGRLFRFFGRESEDFNELEIKTGKQLAEFIRKISGAAVSEQEAQRLARLVPNIDMQDGQFIVSLDDFEDDLNTLIATKLNQFDLFDEEEFRKAVFGGKKDELSISNIGQTAEDILVEFNIN